MINVNMNPITFLNEIHKRGDPRTRDYPLVVNPFFVFPLILGYLYFVKVAGPRWMKNREPFEITNIVRFYNLCMVAVNARFLYVLLKMTYLPGGRYSLWCQGITGYMDEELTKYYKNGWFFVAVRYVDFLDTVFFVLRKKFRQITHLHVIHHTIVAANVWFFALFVPEGHPAFALAINVFVHIIMYSYYFLATLGPGVQKYLWWKKYLTTLQITQFVLTILHMSIPLFVNCGFPRHLILLGNAQTFLILCLFVNFYIHAYNRKSPSKRVKSSTAENLQQNGANKKNA
ncbi:elongation of very long chain fatty acids protein AAEL008004-like [Ixodes scapularis]|uniref:elongation of very long chain fatty acids protein AAEL008004-like n=1 Tax=Ixodes scapularis TaxID=6945 RepID=UPI001A9FB029|nr:elongation of very long chain fatty acids protein AAEL008004-like [Ixodes scapularis]